MSRPDRKEAIVRALMDTPPPPVPPGLYPAAVRRGGRMLRRRKALGRFLWASLCVAALVLVVWLSVTRPWVEPPSQVTPPLQGW